jgi:hypothetical protein
MFTRWQSPCSPLARGTCPSANPPTSRSIASATPSAVYAGWRRAIGWGSVGPGPFLAVPFIAEEDTCMLYVWCVRGGFLSGRNDRVASGRGALFRGRQLLCLVRARRTGAGCAVIRSSEQVGHSGRCGWCPPAPLLPGADSPREHLPIYKSAMDLAVHLDKVVKKIVRWRRRCFADCTDLPGSGHSRGPHRVVLGPSTITPSRAKTSRRCGRQHR